MAKKSIRSQADSAMVVDQEVSSACQLPEFDEINKFFESVLNTIPAQVYFASPAVHIQPAVKNNRYIHKKSGLDPSEHKFRKSGKEKCVEKSIVEIQKDAFLEEAEQKPSASKSSNPENLKERLQEKIRELSAKRQRDPSKPEKTRQRNKKQKLSATEKAEQTASKKAAKHGKAEDATKQSSVEAPEKPQKSAQSKQKDKAIDITIANVDVGDCKKRNKKANGSKKVRLEVALKRAENEKAELEKLSPAERITKQTEISTKLALLKAQGVKIRNDPNLIKKSLKAYDSKKRHSAKKWSKRKQKQAKESEQKASAIRQAID